MVRGGKITAGVIVLLSILVLGVNIVFAQTDEEVKALQDEIAARRAAITDINTQLDEYKAKIKEYSARSSSLINDIALIENTTAMAELDIAATENEIDAQTLEVSLLEASIATQTSQLENQRNMLSNLLFTLHQQEDRGALTAVFGADNFSDAFDAIVQLESVNSGLDRAVDATKQTRTQLETEKVDREQTLSSLVALSAQLSERVEKLRMQQSAKEILVQETSQSEAEYRTLMSKLRQEQQSVSSQVAALQREIEAKLAKNNAATGTASSSEITWPLRGIITALFHDTSYPFRNLFEHSGLDIAVPTGTSVSAAAPGYVAWVRVGVQYGNYVMIIHADGMATLYAHMMRVDVAADQYVERGQQIGLSGGKPGMAGAGLSTGPHLHFEVRKDGIPVNPQSYLPR